MVKEVVIECDECKRVSPRPVDLDGGTYCSRECYLQFCKRKFDSLWFEILSKKEKGNGPGIIYPFPLQKSVQA